VIKSRPAILALLTALNLVNYIDRFLVMAVSERFGAEFGLSDKRRAAVVTAFMLGYMLTSPIFGRLGDRMPRKGLIAAGVALWSLATVLSGFAGGFVTMILARIAVGVGEASYATLSPTIIDDLAPREAKSRWLAIFYTATPVGAALGYILGGVLDPLGWRAAFFICGGPGLLLAAVTLLIHEPARTQVDATHAQPAAGVYREMFGAPQYRYAVLGFVAQTFALGGFTEWAAPFLSRKLDFDLAKGNKVFGVITLLTGLLGTGVGGWIADRIPGEDRARAALKLCAWSSALAAPIGLAALLQPSSTGFLIALGLCELCIFASVSPSNAAVLGSVPLALRASAMAACIFAIHLLGDLLSPNLVGAVSDAFHDPQGQNTGAHGLQIGMYSLPLALALSGYFWFRGAAVVREVPAEAEPAEPVPVK
jgi:MFS family permease